MFRGIFRRALSHVQESAEMLGKKALQSRINVAQDVLEGANVKAALSKQGKKTLRLPSQNSSQFYSNNITLHTKVTYSTYNINVTKLQNQHYLQFVVLHYFHEGY